MLKTNTVVSKRYINLLGAAFLIMISVPCNSGSPLDLLEKANEAYMQNEYVYAAELYEKVLDEGYEAAELYYNLGNAYFKSDHIAKAILNYERAKRIKPNDENILFNLQIARTRIVDRIEPVPRLFYERWWQSVINMQSEKGWAVTAILTGMGLFLALGIFFYSTASRVKKLFFIISIVFLSTTAFSLIFAQKQYNKLTKQTEAIVFVPRLTAKSAPDASSPDLFVIHQGTKVEIKQELGQWYEIRLPNGNMGWIKEESVEVI